MDASSAPPSSFAVLTVLCLNPLEAQSVFFCADSELRGQRFSCHLGWAQEVAPGALVLGSVSGLTGKRRGRWVCSEPVIRRSGGRVPCEWLRNPQISHHKMMPWLKTIIYEGVTSFQVFSGAIFCPSYNLIPMAPAIERRVNS